MIRRPPFLRPLLLFIVLALAACGQATPEPAPGQAGPRVDAAPPADGPLVVFLGDSLTAGYGVSQAEAFPALVGEALAADGVPVRVVNAGVSGDTTAGGLRRLDWVLSQRPEVLVVGLGANDGLRGQPLDEIEGNLRKIVERARGAGSRVLLLGMKLPPSYGLPYAGGFAALYRRLADRLDVPLVPFLLEGVAGDARLNQDDGIHPNARGQRVVAENVLPHLRRLLGR